MAYQEEERTKLRRQGTKQAIALAMEGQWEKAVEANKALLQSFPTDIEAYNRLGRAYIELGEYSLAREAYSQALKLDTYNDIAKKNLQRLSHLEETSIGSEPKPDKVEPQHFIEETGKAGVIELQNLATTEVLARMVAGDRVHLKSDGINLTVENGRGEYLGQVEYKLGQRLIRLMNGGNQYSAAIVSSTIDAVTVIIRETYQDPSQSGVISFPPKGGEEFRRYVGDRIIRRELEYEEASPGEPGYTILGGEEAELLPEDSAEADEEDEDEEES